MRFRLARVAAITAVALLAPAAPAAQAADAPGYVYTAGAEPFVDGFSAGLGGGLAPLARFPSGPGSTGIAASPDGASLYVVNQTDRTVSQYDVSDDGTIAAKAQPPAPTGGSPFGIAVAPDGRHVYVADGDDDEVSIYAADATGALTPLAAAATGDFPIDVALTPDGASAYVTNAGSGTVSQFDVGADGGLTPKAAPTVDAGLVPFGVAVAPGGGAVYVTNDVRAGTVSQFAVGADGALAPMVPAAVAAGAAPVDVVAGERGVYVANSGDASISPYDAGPEGTLTAKGEPIATADTPAAMALSQDGDSLYATGLVASAVAQFDVGADGGLAPKAPAIVPTGSRPVGIAYVVPPDQTAPTVDLRTPADGATYQVGDSVLAEYSCADSGGAELASCVGDVADGAPIDTGEVGEHGFTVVARDGAGHETSVTHGYRVVYDFRGFWVDRGRFGGARAGRTLTIGFSLDGFRGLDVLAPGSPTSARIGCRAPGRPAKAVAARSVRGLRFSARSGNYSFAWLTSRAWAGTCRQFVVALADGTEHRVRVRFATAHRWHW
jgi:DNA-binding beta-propeller fold protein YncE